MNDNKFDLDRGMDSDRGAIRIGVERVVTIAAVIGAFAVLGNTYTDLGVNPANYPAALWFYLER